MQAFIVVTYLLDIAGWVYMGFASAIPGWLWVCLFLYELARCVAGFVLERIPLVALSLLWIGCLVAVFLPKVVW